MDQEINTNGFETEPVIMEEDNSTTQEQANEVEKFYNGD